jgi:hypothetical protein
MDPKLILLKTGDYLVSKIQEAWDEGTFLFYVLTDPRLITITGTYALNEKHSTSVSLFTWPQFSTTTKIELHKDAVLTIVEPTQDLTELYHESCQAKTLDPTRQHQDTIAT